MQLFVDEILIEEFMKICMAGHMGKKKRSSNILKNHLWICTGGYTFHIAPVPF